MKRKALTPIVDCTAVLLVTLGVPVAVIYAPRIIAFICRLI